MDIGSFVNRYYDAIYRYVNYKMHNAESAEDITQEVFLKFCLHFDRCLSANPKAYLYKMAQNAITDHYRRQPFTSELDEQIQSDEDITEDFALKDMIHTALCKLPEEQRETLILRYLCDFSVREIAVAKELSVATVKSRLRLGKAKMKQILKEGGYP